MILQGDALTKLRKLPSCSVQCCVTSPPYWALRDYGVEGQLGLEATPEQYIENMVEVFREVRRVLRDDGTCWLNIGDSYAAGGKLGSPRKGNSSTLQGAIDYQDRGRGSQLPAGLHESQRKAGVTGRAWQAPPPGLKCKDLVGIPWMLAFALRADGWYLRSEVIWAKRSPMPESVKDRPTKSHEQIFLLTKSPKYFYDAIASQETPVAGANGSSFISGKTAQQKNNLGLGPRENSNKRNMRSVWSLASYPLKQAHFAAFPPELVRRCLVAGVSEFGCCSSCGKPFTRLTEKTRVPTRPGTGSKVPKNWDTGPGGHCTLKHNTPINHPKTKHDVGCEQNGYRPTEFGNRDPQRHVTEVVTVGWNQSCSCVAAIAVPCTVLDPFHGAGTTMKVCERLNFNYIGIELNEEYIKLSLERPAVHFPHERKRKQIQRRKHVQPCLFDDA